MTRFLSSLALAAVLTAAPGALQLSAASADPGGKGGSTTSETGEDHSMYRACSNCW